ncbi:aminopeptidase [Mycobacterium malmoense]|uniref:M24 family metallopeptidase n=1 Tax=Mycobacterium malmoense TaxID=1780 RepID=UPI00080BDBD9|nr:M24 family metallopeptidase [Mycobacterium malmoense]OCB33054.1 aminopeptidase [Mycobacterium malmoense]
MLPVCGDTIARVGASAAEEEVRAERLLDAQRKAARLFDEIERRAMIRPGVTEKQLSDEINRLAADLLGVTRHWHRRIVRAGENTLQPFSERPPDRAVADGDIVFLDLGPIFAEWEADFGRTFVLSDDPHKTAVRDALPRVWQAGREYFAGHPDVTGAELYDFVVGVAHAEGFAFASPIAGHLVGEFPHRKIAGPGVEWYIMPGSHKPMRRTDPAGRACHWILEIHLADRARGFGGFYEQLLDLPVTPGDTGRR